jgi:hypothetical protein
VHSFAHGEQNVILAYDAEDIVRLVPKLPGDVVERAKQLKDIYARLYWPADVVPAWES